MGVTDPDHPGSPVNSWQAAEKNAAAWMRHWGYSDARMTPAGADSGIDVRASGAVAQVKFQAAQVGRPALQRLFGAAPNSRDQLLFFTGAGYSPQALRYAEGTSIALFTYDLSGRVVPVNAPARALARSTPPGSPSTTDAQLTPFVHHISPSPGLHKFTPKAEAHVLLGSADEVFAALAEVVSKRATVLQVEEGQRRMRVRWPGSGAKAWLWVSESDCKTGWSISSRSELSTRNANRVNELAQRASVEIDALDGAVAARLAQGGTYQSITPKIQSGWWTVVLLLVALAAVTLVVVAVQLT